MDLSNTNRKNNKIFIPAGFPGTGNQEIMPIPTAYQKRLSATGSGKMVRRDPANDRYGKREDAKYISENGPAGQKADL